MAEKLNQPIVTATITKRVDLFGESSGSDYFYQHYYHCRYYSYMVMTVTASSTTTTTTTSTTTTARTYCGLHSLWGNVVS